jgi:hypothetical protein
MPRINAALYFGAIQPAKAKYSNLDFPRGTKLNQGAGGQKG